MGIVLDVILIVIILLNVIICYKKGLVKLAVGLVAVIVSLILAIILYKPVTNIIIKNTEIVSIHFYFYYFCIWILKTKIVQPYEMAIVHIAAHNK